MKKYQCVLADPPWEYKVWSKKGAGKSAESHSPTMPIDQICALPVADLADRDSALLLWVTYLVLPDAFKVIDAWGTVNEARERLDSLKNSIVEDCKNAVAAFKENSLQARRGSFNLPAV